MLRHLDELAPAELVVTDIDELSAKLGLPQDDAAADSKKTKPVMMEVGKFSASQSLLPGGAAAEPPATESKKAAANDLALAELVVTDCELLSASQKLLILDEAVVMEKGEHPAEYTSQTDETVAEPPATAKKEANVLTLTCRYATAWVRRHPSHLVLTVEAAWLERGDGYQVAERTQMEERRC